MASDIAERKEDVNEGLLQRCQERDPEAYNELFARYNRRILSTAYRILGEESSAEDALQETLLNVYRGLPSFRGESQISTWIGRITINVCLGILRKGKNRHFVDLDDESVQELHSDETPGLDPLAHASQSEQQENIQQSFDRMSAKHGLVVRLHDLEGYTIQEIAQTLHCPVGTVKSRLFYGRQEFKEIYRSLIRSCPRKSTIH